MTGVQNVSLHRLQLSGSNRLGALLLPRHTHMFYEMAERSGQPLDADEMKFKRIRVPGEDQIDFNKVVGPVPSQSWRKALGR